MEPTNSCHACLVIPCPLLASSSITFRFINQRYDSHCCRARIKHMPLLIVTAFWGQCSVVDSETCKQTLEIPQSVQNGLEGTCCGVGLLCFDVQIPALHAHAHPRTNIHSSYGACLPVTKHPGQIVGCRLSFFSKTFLSIGSRVKRDAFFRSSHH